MKRIILLLACLGPAFHPLLAANPCTVADFTTQASVTDFNTTYPGCTQITNTVKISGNGINSLAGLAAVTSIGGDLNVEISQLTSLTGLGALTTLGGNLRIANNSILAGISALSKLTTINGYLSVGNNNGLKSLAGLEGVTTVAGQVSIASNGSLPDLNGLSGITKINGYLNIADNPKLTSVAGLSLLSSLSSSTLKFYLRIFNNDLLTSLSGLDAINSNSINNLIIQGSSQLSVCGVKSICQYLTGTGSINATISDNMAGCMTNVEIVASSACQGALPVDLVSFSGRSGSEGNVLKWITASEINNLGFAIERSSNSRIFEQIGYIEGNGTVNAANSYSFTDSEPATINYYRLKQMDTDSKFTYSSIIVVKSAEQVEAVTIYPNPSDGRLFVKAKDFNQAFKIQTSTGITIQEAAAVPTKPIDTSGLKNGLYLVTVGEEVFKVMVAN